MEKQQAKRPAGKEKTPWGTRSNFWLGLFLASLAINILGLVFPLTLLQVYDRIIPNSAIATLFLFVIGVGSALILEVILRVCRSLVSTWSDARYDYLLTTKTFSKLMNAKIEGYEKEGAGKHFERINATNMLRDFYGGQAIIIMFDIPFTVLFFILIGYLGGWLVAIPIVILLLFAVRGHKLVKMLHETIETRRVTDDQKMNFLIQTLNGIHTVKSMAMEAQMLRRYERLQKSSIHHDFAMSQRSSSIANLSNLTQQIATVLMVAVGSIDVIHQEMTIGALAACILLIGRILNPISRALGIWTRLQSIKIAKQKFQEIRDLPYENLKLPDFPSIKGAINLQDISFTYKGQTEPVLQHINLAIKPGETIILTGEALSGKSTILNLIMGAFDIKQGKVDVDGLDISAYNPQTLRKQISYLPHNGVLFEGTILENLTLFETDLELVEKAKTLAHTLRLDEYISHLPKGYETVLGNKVVEATPRGVIQLICIVRAFIRNPKIVLFDQANTMLDRKTDEIVLEFLKQRKGQQTLVMVTSRPSYWALADRMYTVENGQLSLMERAVS